MRATLKYNKESIIVNIMCSRLDFQILFNFEMQVRAMEKIKKTLYTVTISVFKGGPTILRPP